MKPSWGVLENEQGRTRGEGIEIWGSWSNVLFECPLVKHLIPKTKPITVGIVCKPPDQTRFLEILSNSSNSLDLLNEKWHILGDLNINLYHGDCLYHNMRILGKGNKNIIKGENKVLPGTKVSRIL